jgi:transcriptional regulator with XRE-family HTH domain
MSSAKGTPLLDEIFRDAERDRAAAGLSSTINRELRWVRATHALWYFSRETIARSRYERAAREAPSLGHFYTVDRTKSGQTSDVRPRTRTESDLHRAAHIPMPAMSAPVYDSSESFGRRLRRERERRQIALSSIAENSKISLSFLHDLERDDFSRWPPGIFRRSFMRAYAQAIGVDVEATVREFLERFPDPDPDGLNPPQPALPASPLRLTLDTSGSFAPGQILAAARLRCLAIACDAAVIVTVALAMAVVLKMVWMPLCVVMIGYYAGGILLLGNTPGVRLCAAGRLPKTPSDGTKSSGTGAWRRIWSSAPRAIRSKLHRPVTAT